MRIFLEIPQLCDLSRRERIAPRPGLAAMLRASPALLLPLLALLAGCGSAADKELESVKSARSVLAEWAMVAALREQGRVSATYAEQVAGIAREQLAALPPTLPPDLAAVPEAPTPELLRARGARARALEARLEAR
jgi:hypothetical protein